MASDMQRCQISEGKPILGPSVPLYYTAICIFTPLTKNGGTNQNRGCVCMTLLIGSLARKGSPGYAVLGVSDGVTLRLNLIGQACFAVKYVEVRSRFLDGPLARRNFQCRAPEIECIPEVPRSRSKPCTPYLQNGPSVFYPSQFPLHHALESRARTIGGHVVPTPKDSAFAELLTRLLRFR